MQIAIIVMINEKYATPKHIFPNKLLMDIKVVTKRKDKDISFKHAESKKVMIRPKNNVTHKKNSEFYAGRRPLLFFFF